MTAGVYLLELSTGAIKVGSSFDLLARMRTHENTLRMAGAYVMQSWTCAVSNPREAEDRLLRLFAAMPHVRLVSGRETFIGLGFFEAMALSRDVCSGYPGVAPVMQTPAILTELWHMFAVLETDRIPSSVVLEHLPSDSKWDTWTATELARALAHYGLKPRQLNLKSGANPRGYRLDDLEQVLSGTDWHMPDQRPAQPAAQPGTDPARATPVPVPVPVDQAG